MCTRYGFVRCFALLGVVLVVQGLLAQDVTSQPEGRSVVSYTEALRPEKISARKITIPDVGEYKVLKGDFHIHTVYSGGIVLPATRVRDAYYNGFDVIAITDHVESSGVKGFPKDIDRNMPYNTAKDEAEKRKLLLLHSVEISQKQGHFNAHFISDANPIFALNGDWKAMIAAAVEQGAYIQWNHPGTRAENGKAALFTDDHEELRTKGYLHGVEVFNSFYFFPYALDWCNERDLTPMCDSDIHGTEVDVYGNRNLQRPITLVLAKEKSLESVKEAFFAKRTVGWAANMIFGREPWVEKLFRSCVKIKKTETGLTLQNLSDIPCVIEADGKTSELTPKGSLDIPATKKLTVTNWLVGANKPLEMTP